MRNVQTHAYLLMARMVATAAVTVVAAVAMAATAGIAGSFAKMWKKGNGAIEWEDTGYVKRARESRQQSEMRLKTEDNMSELGEYTTTAVTTATTIETAAATIMYITYEEKSNSFQSQCQRKIVASNKRENKQTSHQNEYANLRGPDQKHLVSSKGNKIL